MVSPMVFKDGVNTLVKWSVTAKVGLHSPNLRDDVDFVQMGYQHMARHPAVKPLLKPDLEAALAKIKLGDNCTGQEDDPLVICIRLHEKYRGGTQDGFVSPVHHGEFSYIDKTGAHAKITLMLSDNLAQLNPEIFPRLDKINGCPATLAAKVRACF